MHGAEALEFAVIDKFPVDFVGNEGQIVFAHDPGDHVHLCFRIDDTGRVARVGQQDGPGTAVDMLFDLFFRRQVVPFVRRSRHPVDAHVVGTDEALVIGVKRLEHKDVVAGITGCHDGKGNGLAAAVRDIDIVQAEVHAPVQIIFADSFQQFFPPLGFPVGKDFGMEGRCRFKEALRRFHIGLTNIQMIDLLPCFFSRIGNGCQFADRGSRDVEGPLRNMHGTSSFLQ